MAIDFFPPTEPSEVAGSTMMHLPKVVRSGLVPGWESMVSQRRWFNAAVDT
jgi:hypothetical protein